HPRQHEIKNNQSWHLVARFLQCGSAIGRNRGRETGLAQIECEKIDHITFVLDDQDCVSGGSFHGSSLYRRNCFGSPANFFTPFVQSANNSLKVARSALKYSFVSKRMQ